MSHHTPTPWAIRKGIRRHERLICHAGLPVAKVYGDFVKEVNANARVIVGAPEVRKKLEQTTLLMGEVSELLLSLKCDSAAHAVDAQIARNRRALKYPLHRKIKSGTCSLCGHVGEDCTGTEYREE